MRGMEFCLLPLKKIVLLLLKEWNLKQYKLLIHMNNSFLIVPFRNTHQKFGRIYLTLMLNISQQGIEQVSSTWLKRKKSLDCSSLFKEIYHGLPEYLVPQLSVFALQWYLTMPIGLNKYLKNSSLKDVLNLKDKSAQLQEEWINLFHI